MRCKLLIGMAGHPMREPGDIVEGDDVARLIAAGYAELVEDEERATIALTKERAVKKPKAE